jgi:hypothetical protein
VAFPTINAIAGSTSAGVQHASEAPANPAGAASGDRVIYAHGVDSNVSNPSTGWTELIQVTAPGGTFALMLGYRDLDGGANDALTLTNGGNAASVWETMLIKSGEFDPATAPAAGGSATGTSANPDAASLNPAGWDVEDTLWLAFAGWDGTPNRSLDPSGWTFVFDQDNNSATFGCAITGWRKNNAAASEDPASWTITASEEWAAAMLAIRPAAAAITKSLTAVTETDTAVALSGGVVLPPSAEVTIPRLGPRRRGGASIRIP